MKRRFNFGAGQPVARTVPFFSASVTPETGDLEILCYEPIGESFDWWTGETTGVTAAEIKRQVDMAGPMCKSITLRINSPGGDVFEGVAMLNVLRSQSKPVKVCIDGIAASAASVVAMAGSEILMGSGAMFMVHQSWGSCVGNSKDMTQMANSLTAIDKSIASTYAERTGMKQDDLYVMMEEESWMTAEECIAKGFATGMQPVGQEIPEQARGAAAELATQFKARIDKVSAKNRALRHAGPIPIDRSAPPVLATRTAKEDPDENDNGCECDCSNCLANNCQDCSYSMCLDEDCKDCPMQASAKDRASEMMARTTAKRITAMWEQFQVQHHAEVELPTGHIFAMRRFNGQAARIVNLAGSAASPERKPGIAQVSGVLAPYNSASCDLGGFVEVYEPGCFNEFLKTDDPRVCNNHNLDQILGRKSAGTARFKDEADGLHYEVDLPDTQPARDLKVSMERGDVNESSAAFYITDHKVEIRGGIRTRVVLQARLVEGGPHAFAAYQESTAATSSQNDDTMQSDNGLELAKYRLRLAQVA